MQWIENISRHASEEIRRIVMTELMVENTDVEACWEGQGWRTKNLLKPLHSLTKWLIKRSENERVVNMNIQSTNTSSQRSRLPQLSHWLLAQPRYSEPCLHWCPMLTLMALQINRWCSHLQSKTVSSYVSMRQAFPPSEGALSNPLGRGTRGKKKTHLVLVWTWNVMWIVMFIGAWW